MLCVLNTELFCKVFDRSCLRLLVYKQPILRFSSGSFKYQQWNTVPTRGQKMAAGERVIRR